MHAIVRKGNGEYYISVILGCYDDTPNDYKHSRYFIVLNEEKDKIIKLQKSLKHLVLGIFNMVSKTIGKALNFPY